MLYANNARKRNNLLESVHSICRHTDTYVFFLRAGTLGYVKVKTENLRS